MALNWKRMIASLAALGVVGGAGFLVITRPQPLPAEHWEKAGVADLANGELVFSAGGCVSCHAAPKSEGDARLVLAGGLEFKTQFGTFYAPNISPDPDFGIGFWTLADFGNALKRGVGKAGEHLYPAFPYSSYSRMSDKDVNDLWAYMQTLPKSRNKVAEHDLTFPFNIRLSLGGWKFLYFGADDRVALANADERVKRGQYLMEGPGHCGECHTPRDILGGFRAGQWLAGAANPDGEGRVPNITPGSKSIGAWSEKDLVTYLETGFTPEFDSVGGSMVEVQKNMAKLPAADREAIAAYLKAIPALFLNKRDHCQRGAGFSAAC